ARDNRYRRQRRPARTAICPAQLCAHVDPLLWSDTVIGVISIQLHLTVFPAAASHRFEVSALVLGGLLVAGALVSGLAGRTFLSLTALFVLVGFLLGEGGTGWLDFDARSG